MLKQNWNTEILLNGWIFVYRWSCTKKGLRLQPAQQACFFYKRSSKNILMLIVLTVQCPQYSQFPLKSHWLAAKSVEYILLKLPWCWHYQQLYYDKFWGFIWIVRIWRDKLFLSYFYRHQSSHRNTNTCTHNQINTNTLKHTIHKHTTTQPHTHRENIWIWQVLRIQVAHRYWASKTVWRAIVSPHLRQNPQSGAGSWLA